MSILPAIAINRKVVVVEAEDVGAFVVVLLADEGVAAFGEVEEAIVVDTEVAVVAAIIPTISRVVYKVSNNLALYTCWGVGKSSWHLDESVNKRFAKKYLKKRASCPSRQNNNDTKERIRNDNKKTK